MSNIFKEPAQQSDKNTSHKTWQQYQDLRRSSPKRYYNARTQREMVQDRLQLGREAFYGEDY